jgi:hypothetical protein
LINLSFVYKAKEGRHVRIVYNFIICCLGEALQRVVAQRHLCFEFKKKGDNSTINRVLKIMEARMCFEF